MRIQFYIQRRPSQDAAVYTEELSYETENENATVATALTELNISCIDASGKTFSPILWECSCLQKKCGACAMVINGRPALACDFFLRNAKNHKITLEPLHKFPLIGDLKVDRSILMANLSTMKQWAASDSSYSGKGQELAYQASGCLQCGCCLEVCPNVAIGEPFYGAAAFVPATRLLAALDASKQEEIRQEYRKHVYAGCGKSLACEKICPAGLEVGKLLANSNAAAVWRRKL